MIINKDITKCMVGLQTEENYQFKSFRMCLCYARHFINSSLMPGKFVSQTIISATSQIILR